MPDDVDEMEPDRPEPDPEEIRRAVLAYLKATAARLEHDDRAGR